MFHPIFLHSSLNERTSKQSQRNVATQTLLPVVDTQAVVRRECAGELSPSQRVTDGSDKKTEPPGSPHKIQTMIHRNKLTRKKQEPKFIVRFSSWRVVTQKMLVITKCSFVLFSAAALHPRLTGPNLAGSHFHFRRFASGQVNSFDRSVSDRVCPLLFVVCCNSHHPSNWVP